MANLASPIDAIFLDNNLLEKIQRKLPSLFELAEQQASRAGRVGMEVGTIREQILIALLIYKFGEENVDLDIPINEQEIDVRVSGHPLSIKTVTAKSQGAPPIKIIWTVDWDKVEEFKRNYEPRYDMILVIVSWGRKGKFCGIPSQAQKEVFAKLGRERYLRFPKHGTNPRGVDICSEGVKELLKHPLTRCLEIEWKRSEGARTGELRLVPYKRWLEYWKSD